MHSKWLEPTSPAVLARAIRSLLGDQAMHSTGFGSCFSPTCRKAGMVVAGRYGIKTEELIRMSELNSINILTTVATLPYCERQAYFPDVKSALLQQIHAFASYDCQMQLVIGDEWCCKNLIGPEKNSLAEELPDTVDRFSSSVAVIDQRVVSKSTRLVFGKGKIVVLDINKWRNKTYDVTCGNSKASKKQYSSHKIHILIMFSLVHWRRHISSLTNHRRATEADERQ